jgi:predicted Zn-dependent protease
MRQLVRHIAAAAAGAAALLGLSPAAHAQGLIRDTEIEAVMRDYADPLIAAAGLDVQSVDFYLIGDDSFNAFVTGGQNIFMHTGAIVIADRPLEIKGVIAHEIGHISGAHIARSQEAARGSMATMAATVGLGIIAALAGEGGAGAALIASGSQFAQLDFLAYTRSQEAAADQAALSYLEATGQSAQGLIATFERFRYQEVMSNQRRMEYFRSHPLSSQRIDAMRRRAEASPYFEREDTPEEIAELRRIQAKIIGFLYPPGQTFTRFPESDQSLPARYARSVAFYKEGRLERAREEIALLLEMEPDNPFFHELDGQMLYESGEVEASIAPYERAVELMPEAELIRIALAASLVAAGGEDNLEKAKTHLR